MPRVSPSNRRLGLEVATRIDGKAMGVRHPTPPVEKVKAFRPYVWRDTNRVKDAEE